MVKHHQNKEEQLSTDFLCLNNNFASKIISSHNTEIEML